VTQNPSFLREKFSVIGFRFTIERHEMRMQVARVHNSLIYRLNSGGENRNCPAIKEKFDIETIFILTDFRII
jgi:hypothetical protein